MSENLNRKEVIEFDCEVVGENERDYGRPFAHLRRIDKPEGPVGAVFVNGFLIAGKMRAGRRYKITIEDVSPDPLDE
jgi:hypothetical protein